MADSESKLNVSLKEYIEEKFRALDALRKQEAATLVIQAAEYERRLNSLNNEASRIDAAAAKSVSNSVFDTFLQGDMAWKSQSERDRSSHLPRAEFDAQHKALSDKLTVLSERLSIIEASRGRVDVMHIFSVASSVAAVISVVYVLLTRH